MRHPWVSRFLDKANTLVSAFRWPARRRIGIRLLVDGVPSFFTDQQLRELFLPYGNVLSATVMRYPNGESLEFGYVHMAEAIEAAMAILRLNGTQLYSKVLAVRTDGHMVKEPPSDF